MRRPNILIIYPDQMRFDAMGCAGNPVLRTPNVDRLAAEGVRFDRAYTAFPLCAPFRASLFTGKYPHSAGMYANHYPIPLDQQFLPAILRAAGYQTAYFGKWHLDGGQKHGYVPPGPKRLGFEHFVGFSRGHEYFGSIYYRDSPEPLTSDRYEPDYQTDHLLEFIEACAADPSGRPFFAEINYGPPHPPLVAPQHYLELYSPEEVPIRENVPKDPEARRRARDFLARYYGLISAVDDNVGRVLQRLDELNLARDTFILFVSDHGEMAGEHGCYAKKRFYEASMRVPMIVRYPAGIPGGRVVEALVDPSVDTMPTLLELCSTRVPAGVQGTSYLPLLDGTASSVRREIYYEICMEREGPERFPVPERGVRTMEWLYVATEAGPKVLFDLRNDALEMENLVDSPAHQPVLSALDRRLREHMAASNDDWSIEAVFPPPDFMTHEEGKEVWRRLRERARKEG